MRQALNDGENVIGFNGYYRTAQDVFETLYDFIMHTGTSWNDTKAIFNCSVVIDSPLERAIETPWRGWNPGYAEKEWQWYISGDRNAEEIAKHASIWRDMMDEDGNVWSNYGWQWMRRRQLSNIIKELKENPGSRRAAITLYDGKEFDQYERDYPCTMSVVFWRLDDKLHMSVNMRSNDLVYGFCNDQYCFSKLQELVAETIGIPLGIYHHHATNMHIYERHFDLKERNKLCETPQE